MGMFKKIFFCSSNIQLKKKIILIDKSRGIFFFSISARYSIFLTPSGPIFVCYGYASFFGGFANSLPQRGCEQL